jgi:SpoIID/LytB domain protein
MGWFSMFAPVRARGRIGAALAALLLAGGLVATPAAAEEVYLRPADGAYPLDGRGYGHGIGMSQYGARGAASAGLTWRQIIESYYPGTTIGDNGNPAIRVRLVGQTALAVRADSGLRVNLDRTGTPTVWQVLPPTVARGGAALAVESWDLAFYTHAVADPVEAAKYTGWWLRFRPVGGSSYLNHRMVGASALTVAFDNPGSGVLRKASGTAYRTYRGELRHVRSSNLATATVTVVDTLPMESYLRGVVPNEMPSSWAAEAVRSQAVAARTYAEYERRHAPAGRAYDTCDTTSCQVMGSVETEQAAADAAIGATAGQIALYSGGPAFTQFSAANGGYTVAGSQPYLVAKADPYDTYTWQATVAATSIERAWPAIGRLTALRVTQRDGHGAWGGRVTQLVLQGTSGSVTVSGASFRSALGLKSTHFTPRLSAVSAPSFPRDVTSDLRGDVVAVISSTGELRVYAGSGTGSFARVITAATSGWSEYRKVFSAGTWGPGAGADLMAVDSAGSLLWFPGTGAGTFGAPQQVGRGFDAFDVLFPTGDFNRDGGTDVVARKTDGTLWLVKGDGQGAVLGLQQIGNGWESFTAIFSPGDFTGDRVPDVLGRDGAGELWLYPGNGAGGFLRKVRIGWGWGGFSSLTSPGDFSGDGRADVIARSGDGRLWMYLGSGTGGWAGRVQIGKGWNALNIVP